MGLPAKESCYKCESTYKSTQANPCDDCVVMIKTRAEQIRAMSDEELAQFLDALCRDAQEGKIPDRDWLDWLGQKAAE